MKKTILIIIITVISASACFSQVSAYKVNSINNSYTNSSTSNRNEGTKALYNNYAEESQECKLVDAVYG